MTVQAWWCIANAIENCTCSYDQELSLLKMVHEKGWCSWGEINPDGRLRAKQMKLSPPRCDFTDWPYTIALKKTCMDFLTYQKVGCRLIRV